MERSQQSELYEQEKLRAEQKKTNETIFWDNYHLQRQINRVALQKFKSLTQFAESINVQEATKNTHEVILKPIKTHRFLNKRYKPVAFKIRPNISVQKNAPQQVPSTPTLGGTIVDSKFKRSTLSLIMEKEVLNTEEIDLIFEEFEKGIKNYSTIKLNLL